MILHNSNSHRQNNGDYCSHALQLVINFRFIREISLTTGAGGLINWANFPQSFHQSPCKMWCPNRWSRPFNNSSQDIPMSMWDRGVSHLTIHRGLSAIRVKSLTSDIQWMSFSHHPLVTCGWLINAPVTWHEMSAPYAPNMQQNETMVNGSLLANEILMDPI